MKYNFREIEAKWQAYWRGNGTFRAEDDAGRPKYYVLDMFPYPSGTGLHVGHPLGYIASDICARYRRMKGFNVLHPMGYDAFGLPAEQYAIETGRHPAETTARNIGRYREQMDMLGFSFDWDREVRTSDPSYYRWTQWIFLKLFGHWYNRESDRAEPLASLTERFERGGSTAADAACSADGSFTAEQWKAMDDGERQRVLLNYRLAYLSEAVVNWCPALGTVLANDEVKDGVSERGGHPVVQKKMKQWSLRITAYADRLLKGLDQVEWSEALKEMQRNWIGKSFGADISFTVHGTTEVIRVFTTRPDTIFGATFMVLAPEHELVDAITTRQQRQAVDDYIRQTSRRSERERMADVKSVTGCFTGAHAVNPFTGKKIPVWIADYVLAGYGTGAIMAVPAGDARDWRFARHFSLPVVPVIEGQDASEGPDEGRDGVMINSGFLDGRRVPDAIRAAIGEIEKKKIGRGTVVYKLRDAVFGRQRYWGEPFPIYYKDGLPQPVDESDLPVLLPEVDDYRPTEDGEPPLARAAGWKYKDTYPYELTTMPGWAGSSWYWLRYMDPRNGKEPFSASAEQYWKEVDLYIGGSEHATGHLLYARFWNHFLYDIGLVSQPEPFRRLVNQGMVSEYPEYITELRIDPPEKHGKWEGRRKRVRILKGRCKGCEVKVPASGPGSHAHVYVSADCDLEFTFVTPARRTPIATRTSRHYANVAYIRDSVLDVSAWFAGEPVYAGSVLLANDGYFANGKWRRYDSNKVGYKGKFLTRKSDTLEKMSKSKLNVYNPDAVVEKYGADTLRLFEMFLGPLTDHKPWDTKGIEGTHRFLRKVWKLCGGPPPGLSLRGRRGPSPTLPKGEGGHPSKEELRALHKTIRKVTEDIERLSFNTAVSALMICVNELTAMSCRNRDILEKLVVLVAPFAPHIAEELWQRFGHGESVSRAAWPGWDAQYVADDAVTYPVSFNGRTRFTVSLPPDMPPAEIEKEVLSREECRKWLEGRAPKKVIVVPGRIVNVVV